MDNTTTSGDPDGEAVVDWLLRAVALAGVVLGCLAVFMRACPGAAAKIYNVVCCRKHGNRVDIEAVHEAAEALHEVAERVGTPIPFLSIPRPPPRRPSPAPPPPPENENIYAVPQDLALPNLVVTAASSPASSNRVFTPVEPPPSPVPPQFCPEEDEQDTTAPVLQVLSAESLIALATADPPLTGRNKKETPVARPIAIHIDDEGRWLERERFSRGSMRL